MTKTKRLRVLSEIYARVPEVHCKGLCYKACTSVPVFEIERSVMESASGAVVGRLQADELNALPTETLPTLTGMPGDQCTLLVMNRCAAYQGRPLICRVFGAAEGIRCPHGCVPDRVISDEDVNKMIEEIAAVTW